MINETITLINETGGYSTATYNTGCYTDLQAMALRCTQFKVQVLQTFHARFLTGYIILVILLFIRIYLTNKQSHFLEHNMIGRYLDGLLDLAIIFLSIGILYLILFI